MKTLHEYEEVWTCVEVRDARDAGLAPHWARQIDGGTRTLFATSIRISNERSGYTDEYRTFRAKDFALGDVLRIRGTVTVESKAESKGE